MDCFQCEADLHPDHDCNTVFREKISKLETDLAGWKSNIDHWKTLDKVSRVLIDGYHKECESLKENISIAVTVLREIDKHNEYISGDAAREGLRLMGWYCNNASGCDDSSCCRHHGEIFKVGDSVEKFTGDYQLTGIIRAVFITSKNATRYVVEHKPGFLHIYAAANIRKVDHI